MLSAVAVLQLYKRSTRGELQFAMQVFDLQPSSCLQVSAKTGFGLETVLPAVIERIPHPAGDPDRPLRMLLFDAYHDEYRSACLLFPCWKLTWLSPWSRLARAPVPAALQQPKSAGPLQQPGPCLAQACTQSMLLLWAECSAC